MVLRAARQFLDQLYEGCIPGERWLQVEREVQDTGSYVHTLEELEFGARLAWRNSARCIGRLVWRSLQVFDCRQLCRPTEIFQACQQQARWSTNQGRIRPAISIFSPQAPPIRNRQFFSYAGFDDRGDPALRTSTRQAMDLGWRPPESSDFVLLPLMIGDEFFEWSPEDCLEVNISHPEADWSRFGWRWYALPAVSNMLLEIGGVNYTTAPFSGYYMVTEVGSRDLGDLSRYNLLPKVAENLGFSGEPLWQDRATYELNRAVLHSYRQAGVSMVDHHTASAQFIQFCQQEETAGRPVSAQWSWIVPPTCASATEVFFKPMRNLGLRPNFLEQ
ncbi:nitric oxide synthase oxygenase [bacterium]|nr:nitric oxide synthase oxygenase [bacterium]